MTTLNSQPKLTKSISPKMNISKLEFCFRHISEPHVQKVAFFIDFFHAPFGTEWAKWYRKEVQEH